MGYFLCFFFQAEDGIRDAQESRGLGDVYKRQGQFPGKREHLFAYDLVIFGEVAPELFNEQDFQWPVSYTHLTLPTIYSV